MPRNGSGVMSRVPGTTAVAGDVIESAKYNDVIDDIIADLNDPRPITSGGTGSGTVAGARTNLGVDAARTFVTKSANYTALATDKNAHIRFDGAYTLSLTAAATLGSGWYCFVQADGGDVVIDPNSTEQVNGATTVTLPDSYSTIIWCTGSAFLTSDDWATISNTLSDLSETKQDNSGELYRGHINGLTLSNNASDATNDIDIATGSAGSDGATPVLMTLASALTKRLDASWAVGDGNGGLDAGSIADTTYHVWLIQRSDTGVVDILLSASSSSPTMPTNYDRKRRVGSIIRSSGAVLAFSQNGDEFLLDTQPVDVNTASLSTTAVLYTLTIPSGVVVDAIITANGYRAAGIGSIILTSPAVTDQAPGGGTAPTSLITPNDQFGTWSGRVRSNTSSQIRARAATAINTFLVTTAGWIDTRGRLS